MLPKKHHDTTADSCRCVLLETRRLSWCQSVMSLNDSPVYHQLMDLPPFLSQVDTVHFLFNEERLKTPVGVSARIWPRARGSSDIKFLFGELGITKRRFGIHPRIHRSWNSPIRKGHLHLPKSQFFGFHVNFRVGKRGTLNMDPQETPTFPKGRRPEAHF